MPHASEVLTGRYSQPPDFDPGDHRSHRRHEWMTQALKKADQVKFLAEERGRTLSQAAIKFCLAQGTIVCVLPNITNMEELEEYTSAPDVPDLTQEECEQLDDLWENGFLPGGVLSHHQRSFLKRRSFGSNVTASYRERSLLRDRY